MYAAASYLCGDNGLTFLFRCTIHPKSLSDGFDGSSPLEVHYYCAPRPFFFIILIGIE